MKNIILVLGFYLISISVFACKFENITGDDKESETKRLDLFENSSKPGVRFAWNNLKQMNQKYLIGTVDDIVQKFESEICDKIKSNQFERKYPGANILVQKTDFKGYFITCTPEERCKNIDLEKKLSEIEPPSFPKQQGAEFPEKFNLTTASGDNYPESYMEARRKEKFPNSIEKQNLAEFINQKLEEGILKATGKPDIKLVDIKDPEFMTALETSIHYFRKNEFDKVDPKFLGLVEVLDLMEIPFQGSNNFDAELTTALETSNKIPSEKPTNLYQLDIARGGDDLIMVVKKDGIIEKVVGADAQGLGSVNMITRLESYLDYSQQNKPTSEISNLIQISSDALKKADEKMLNSMNAYEFILEYNLNYSGLTDIDQIIRLSHEDYLLLGTDNLLDIDSTPSLRALNVKLGATEFQSVKTGLMRMRAGAINGCGVTNKCVKDRITNIHNTLKVMEQFGVEGHFGDSCIGTEYWARKFGAKGIRSTK